MKPRGPVTHAFARQLGREVRTFCGLLGKRSEIGDSDQIFHPFTIQLPRGGVSNVIGIADKSNITCQACRKALRGMGLLT